MEQQAVKNVFAGYEGYKVKPAWSIEQAFVPRRWLIYPVSPLFNEAGDLLGYASDMSGFGKVAYNIPNEMFNHEFYNRSVLDDPDFMAEIMNEFGLIGQFGFPYDWVNIDILMDSRENPGSILDMMRIDHQHLAVHGFISNESVAEYVEDLRKAVDKLGITRGCIVSPLDVSFVMNTILDSADIYKALAQSDDPAEVLTLIASADPSKDWIVKMGPENYVEGHVATTLNDLSLIFAENYRPMAGIVFGPEEVDPHSATFDWQYGPNGSLDEAMALQVWEFGLHIVKEGYFICKDCGKLFRTKRSKGTRARRASDRNNAFCCDQCLSKFTSRKSYRKKVTGDSVND